MRTLILTFAFISSSAFACPNLAGTYAQCKSDTGQMEETGKTVVTQASRGNITTYTVVTEDPTTHEQSTETYRTDGRVYSQTTMDQDTGISLVQKTSSTCVGDKLQINVTITIQNELFASLKTSVSKKDNTYVQETSGTSMGETINDTVTCF